MKFQSLKGMKDRLPPASRVWEEVERGVRDVFRRYGFTPVDTPILETADLFVKGTGAATDIVGKEMYTLTDKGNEQLALRPEMTPGVVRAFVQHGYGVAEPLVKFSYIGPMFRQERPQAGRFRQFQQYGVEAIGSQAPALDAEVIACAVAVLENAGVRDFSVRLNSIGCPVCRPGYRDALTKFLEGVSETLSEESRARMRGNPLRVLDSKDERDRAATAGAPVMLDSLCAECRAHFDEVVALVKAMELRIEIDPRIVRGLDYYTKTVFEVTSTDLGSQDALAGGGRYDLLVEQLGGRSTPAVGFAAGFERLMMVVEKNKSEPAIDDSPQIYIAAADAAARATALAETNRLRRACITAACDVANRSLKAQLREANRIGAKRLVVLGEEERSTGVVRVKLMASGEETEVRLEALAETINARENDKR